MPDAFWKSATKPSAMYSGQFEIRNVPLAGPLSWGVVVWPDCPLSEPHAARKVPPRASPAAAAAPPPMKRRREVRLAARRAASWGSIASKFLEGMATVPFVNCRRKGRDYGQRLGVVEHLLEILGGGNVGGGQHQRRIGRPADVHLVAGSQHRQVLLRADVGENRRVVKSAERQPHHRTLERQVAH